MAKRTKLPFSNKARKSAEAAARLQQAISLHSRGLTREAHAIYTELLRRDPKNFDALHFLGVLELQNEGWQKGISLIEAALSINPHAEAALINLGNGLRGARRFEDAIVKFDESVAINPFSSTAFNNRGMTWYELRRFDRALDDLNNAIALEPTFVEAYYNRGNVYTSSAAIDEALRDYDTAIAMNPNYVEAYVNRALLLNAAKRCDEALKDLQRARDLKPSIDFIDGLIQDMRMKICDWSHFDRNLRNISARIVRHERATPPFQFLTISPDRSLQKQASKLWADSLEHRDDSALKYPRRSRIRIGYFSSDFYTHAIAHLVLGLFEHHDRENFEAIAFSFGPNHDDAYLRAIRERSDSFIDVREMSDTDVIFTARKLEIDIAVDLKGYTVDARSAIFGARAAPSQINYLGYPGTMATRNIDYIIADRTLIPPDHQSDYFEKIVYLPDTYQANYYTPTAVERTFLRSELELADDQFVFCCFNNNFKITPDRFSQWSRILQAVEGSVLWLLKDSETVETNLRKEAASRGIDPNRLVFAPRVPLADHLARHSAADLFLDTLPYNAHTTASDALWAELPVVTQIGETFSGRVAASLLYAIGLPELVTHSAAEYEDLAIALAHDPDRLSAIKRRLAIHRTCRPLFDSKLYTKNLESAYRAVYERQQNGLLPDHIYVASPQSNASD